MIMKRYLEKKKSKSKENEKKEKILGRISVLESGLYCLYVCFVSNRIGIVYL